MPRPIIVSIVADTAHFARGMQSARGQLQQFRVAVQHGESALAGFAQQSKMLIGALKGFAALAVVHGMRAIVTEAAALADEISDIAERLNISAQSVQVFRFAALNTELASNQ